MRIESNILTSQIQTDYPDLIETLVDRYSYYVPGYQYVPAYKNRGWDGKKRYISNNGTFRTGLLNRILKDLDSIGCTEEHRECITNFPKPTIDLVEVNEFKYRDYQKEAITYCLGNQRCIVDSPTGSGKTLIMAGLLASILEWKLDIVGTILFKEKQHLIQAYEFFKDCGLENIGINFGDGFIPANIMLSTIQSLSKIVDTHLDQSELLIIDEAHLFCAGGTTIAAIQSFQNAYLRYAFTATVPGERAKTVNNRLVLEGAFGPVYTTRTAQELVEDGSLAKPIIQFLEFEPEQEVDPDISYQEAYEDYIVNSLERNNKIKSIVEITRNSNKKAKILILVNNLEHIKKLLELIPDAFVIEGKDKVSDRYSTIKDFLNPNKSSVLIGSKVMQTGVSINEITHMINARGLEGEAPTIQALGRSLRKSDGLDTVYFYDFYDRVPYLEKHSKQRIKHYKKLKFEVNYVRL